MTTDKSLSARDQVLHRICVANGGISDAATAQSEWSALARGYKRSATQPREAVLNLLEDRLRDYDAQVIRSTPADVPRSIAERLSARGKQRLVVPPGFPAAWLPPSFTFVLDESLTPAELDGVDGIITASTVAIAETGTVVLQNVPGQGRRAATLVPDLSPLPGPRGRRRRDGARGHGKIAENRSTGHDLRLRSFRDRRHRDDPHQGSSRPALPGCDPHRLKRHKMPLD